MVGELHTFDGSLRADFKKDISKVSQSLDRDIGECQDNFKEVTKQIGVVNY